MAVIGQGVTLLGLEVSSDAITFNLPATVTEKDEGKALTIDSSAANQMKLAGDGDPIHAWLEKVEVREIEGIVVGTAFTRGWFKFPTADKTIALGDSVVGAGEGAVKKAEAYNGTYVSELGDDYVVARFVA